MNNSVRELAIVAVSGLIADAMPDHGVYRAERDLIDTDLPAVTVWDQDEATDHRAGSFAQAMTMQIEVMRDVGSENFSVEGNSAIADIKAAVFSGDPTIGGKIDGINLVSSRIDYPDNGTEIVKTVTEIIVQYSEKRGDPTAQPI